MGREGRGGEGRRGGRGEEGRRGEGEGEGRGGKPPVDETLLLIAPTVDVPSGAWKRRTEPIP